MIIPNSPYGLAQKISEFFTEEGGFFIEAGANDGIRQNNTLYLENELGWRGLLVEPNKHQFENCIKNRNKKGNIIYNCALVGYDYKPDDIEGYFNENDYENSLMAQVSTDNPEFSEADPRWHCKLKVRVPAKKLSDILTEHNVNKIDFFSLDVEGYELNVLQGLDFSRHSPKIICVEIRNLFNTQNFIEITTLLVNNNYLPILTVGHNYFFEKDREC